VELSELPPLRGDELISDLGDRGLRLLAEPLYAVVREVPARHWHAGEWADVEREGRLRLSKPKQGEAKESATARDGSAWHHWRDPDVLLRWIEATWKDHQRDWQERLGPNIGRDDIRAMCNFRNAHAHNNYARTKRPLRDIDVRGALVTIQHVLTAIDSSREGNYVAEMVQVLERRTQGSRRFTRWQGLRSNRPRPSAHTFGLHWVEPEIEDPDRSPGRWWLAHLDRSGKLQGGLGRHTTEYVIDYLTSFDPTEPVLGGCAFCFSTPAWFAHKLAGSTGKGTPWQDVWLAVEQATSGSETADVVAASLNAECGTPDTPFWLGWQNQPDPNSATGLPTMRATEEDVLRDTEARPESVFRIGGAASVGGLAVWGIPTLRRLRESGYQVWPLDEPGGWTIVEIFPRALWSATQPGAAVRSSQRDRVNFLDDHLDLARGSAIGETIVSERRAFDAVYTAWALRRYGGNVEKAAPPDSPYATEGRIWLPSPPSSPGPS
jgi:hypothetical protein